MTRVTMNPTIDMLARRIAALTKRAEDIESRIVARRDVPKEIQIADVDMIELEKLISTEAASASGVPSIPRAIWRPFWTAAYEDWGDRSGGPEAFWGHVRRHLKLTADFLLSLSQPSNERDV
jgi:hypothetical protein